MSEDIETETDAGDLEESEEPAEKEPEPEPVEDGDQPEIDPEEMADLTDIAKEIEEETRPDPENDGQTPDKSGEDTPADADITESDVSVGKIYTNMLGMGAAVARDELGSGVEDRKSAMEDYGQLARDFEIDVYVDQWMKEHGGPDSMSPGQAMIVMSVAFAGMVAMDDPEMLDALIPGGEGDE